MAGETERVSQAGHAPPWTRHEHQARYEFAATYAPGLDVVDCASGDGTCGGLMAEAGAWRVLGFDLSEAAVSDARRSQSRANLEFAVADATALPLPPGSSDLFVSLETIEHLDDERSFLAEVVRVLRGTGTFICSTPDRDVYSPGNKLGSRPWNRFHTRERSQGEFVDLLSDYFASVTLFGQNRKSARFTSLRCQLGKRIPADLVVRATQFGKLPRFAYDQLDQHRVRPIQSGYRYEFLVAVCREPQPRQTA